MQSTSPFKSSAGLVRIWRALRYSLAGLRIAWRTESAFRQELVLALVLTLVCIALPASLTQKALMLATLMLVLVTELLNSAVEATVDRISLENHELAKRAKDTGSAAVFVALLNVAVVWGLILFDLFAA